MFSMSLFLLSLENNIKKKEYHHDGGHDEGRVERAADVIAYSPALTTAHDRCDGVATGVPAAAFLWDTHLQVHHQLFWCCCLLN